DVERVGTRRVPIELRKRERRRDTTHVLADAQLVREQRQIRAAVAKDLDQDLLVEAGRMLEIGRAAERLAIVARHIGAIADKPRRETPPQRELAIAKPLRRRHETVATPAAARGCARANRGEARSGR